MAFGRREIMTIALHYSDKDVLLKMKCQNLYGLVLCFLDALSLM